MKHLTKAAVVAALAMGAGAANASIDYTSGGSNEAYLAAYDFTTGKTFNFDTGVTFNTFVANIGNLNFSLNFDLSNDANWTNFITGASLNKIKWVAAVGNSLDIAAAITAKQPLPNDVAFNFSVPAALENRAIDMNAKMGPINPATNVSSLVLDSEAPFSGQYGDGALLWGASWTPSQEVEAAYGETIAFQLGQFFLDASDENNPILRNDVTLLGHWTLAGNSLSFKSYQPAPVPVPAAVWMFGTGLLGLMGFNRRKSV